MLAKRDAPAPSLDITKALGLWNGYVDLVQARDKISKSAAIDRASKEMPELLEMAKMVSGAGTVLKVGTATGIPDRKPNTKEYQDAGGKVVSPTVDSGHFAGHPDPTQPFDSVSSTETGDEALARYRREHPGKVAQQFQSIVDAKVASGMGAAQAVECAIRECPEAKFLSAADMIAAQAAAERDANQLRRSPGADGGRREMSQTPAVGP
jgi:hypothetical protein